MSLNLCLKQRREAETKSLGVWICLYICRSHWSCMSLASIGSCRCLSKSLKIVCCRMSRSSLWPLSWLTLLALKLTRWNSRAVPNVLHVNVLALSDLLEGLVVNLLALAAPIELLHVTTQLLDVIRHVCVCNLQLLVWDLLLLLKLLHLLAHPVSSGWDSWVCVPLTKL